MVRDLRLKRGGCAGEGGAAAAKSISKDFWEIQARAAWYVPLVRKVA